MMSKKAHGTTENAPAKDLRFGCDLETTDRVCAFNRHYAEHSGYSFQAPRTWLKHLAEVGDSEVTYYCPFTGKPLFVAPKGRTQKEFIEESAAHGWPSFRDAEVIWDDVRCLKNGEAITVDGVHLGHNLPDSKGNRYCINLVSCCGMPPTEPKL